MRWRVSKDGYDPIEVAFTLFAGPKALELTPKGTTPPGMIRVPAGKYQLYDAPPVQLEEYYLDQLEVTNRQFKEFVESDAGRRVVSPTYGPACGALLEAYRLTGRAPELRGAPDEKHNT